MKYSVIIPAYNEAKNIAQTIAALKLQNIDRKKFEIIVVDNNSTDDTYDASVKAGADIIIKEPKKGTNIARQAGYKKSKGEIVAFLDADSRPPPDWLEKITNDLSKKDIAAASGPFDYGFKGAEKIINDVYTQYILPRIPQILEFIFRRKAGILIGGNFAAKRNVIETIGGLPPLVFWGDDVAIAMLISRRVGKVLFDINLTVRSSSRRLKKQGFLKTGFRYIIAYLKTFFSKEFI